MQEVLYDHLFEKDGITYLKITKTPFTGNSLSYWGNGNLAEKIPFKNGKKNGSRFSFYSNKQLQENTLHINGEKEGLAFAYWKNGNLKTKCTFKRDKLNGILEEYNADGSLWYKQSYKNGEIIPETTIYFEKDGSVKEEDESLWEVYQKSLRNDS